MGIFKKDTAATETNSGQQSPLTPERAPSLRQVSKQMERTRKDVEEYRKVRGQ